MTISLLFLYPLHLYTFTYQHHYLIHNHHHFYYHGRHFLVILRFYQVATSVTLFYPLHIPVFSSFYWETFFLWERKCALWLLARGKQEAKWCIQYMGFFTFLFAHLLRISLEINSPKKLFSHLFFINFPFHFPWG